MVTLNSNQQQVASIVTKAISEAGQKITGSNFTNKEFIAGVLANAKAESDFKPDTIGDGGNSIGIFQLNKQGAASGLTGDQFQALADPTKNTQHLFEREKKHIQDIYQKAESGQLDRAGVASEFSKKVERPADKEGQAAKRADIAQKMDVEGIINNALNIVG